VRCPATHHSRLAALEHFDVVGDDRQINEFHGGVLGQLFGMVGGGAALQDEAGGKQNDMQIADAIAQSAMQHVFEPFLFR
jgi:hypothetical protein